MYDGRANGPQPGRYWLDLMEMVLPPGDRIQSEDEFRTIATDLRLKGYITESDEREYKHDPDTIDYWHYAIAARGVSLIEQSIAPDPDIEDDRIIR